MTQSFSIPPPPPDELKPPAGASDARKRVYEVIFGHETTLGRRFDIALIFMIVASILAIILESVPAIQAVYGGRLRVMEWFFTVLFTIEYVVRLWCVGKSIRYARSFFGLVDLIAIAPTWLSVILPGGQVLTVVRILRVLRVFRILKLAQYMGEAQLLADALTASRAKITVFLFSVLNIVLIVGSLMYLVEGPEGGVDSIPRGIYWGIVTLTTVGYGDVAPVTGLGQTIAAILMIMGYAIIAVPTGIVTLELGKASDRKARQDASASAQVSESTPGIRCPACDCEGHAADAAFCRRCGEPLSG